MTDLQVNHVVIFDGVCNLCENTVIFLIKIDHKKQLSFTHNQSEFAQEVFQRLPVSGATDSIFFLKDEKLYKKSQAVFEILKLMPFPYRLGLIARLLPRSLTDTAYDFIARHRYKMFGKKDQCLVPTAELKSRFLN